MRLVLVGPPGAGKGTQADIVTARLGIPKISTGDLFRSHVSNGTELGRVAKGYLDSGDLVPDEVTNAMVRERLGRSDATDGFLLDGFPRNVAQAKILDGFLSDAGVTLDRILELKVDTEEVVRRLAGRRSCRHCAAVYHVALGTTLLDQSCSVCGGELYQREDDREDVIRKRLTVYAEQTAPVIGFYADRGLLVSVEATGSVAEVTSRALRAIDGSGS
jgi:adenylate kinase